MTNVSNGRVRTIFDDLHDEMMDQGHTVVVRFAMSGCFLNSGESFLLLISILNRLESALFGCDWGKALSSMTAAWLVYGYQ